MKAINNTILSIIVMLAGISVAQAVPATEMCKYSIISIDTLKNGVYLIYLYGDGGVYKSVSITDPSVADCSQRVEIGGHFDLMLEPLRPPMDSNTLFMTPHAKEVVVVEKNTIAIDSQRGVKKNIYLIENMNGLCLFDHAVNMRHKLTIGGFPHNPEINDELSVKKNRKTDTCQYYQTALEKIMAMENIHREDVAVSDSVTELCSWMPTEDMKAYPSLQMTVDHIRKIQMFNPKSSNRFSECLHAMSCDNGYPDHVVFFSDIYFDEIVNGDKQYSIVMAEMFNGVRAWIDRHIKSHPNRYLINSETNTLIIFEKNDADFKDYDALCRFNESSTFLFLINIDGHIETVFKSGVFYD